MGQIYDSLISEFQKLDDPLKNQVEGLEGELEKCRFDSDREVKQLSAKLKLLDQDILQLTSEGKFERVEEKESEKRKISGLLLIIQKEREEKVSAFEKKIEALEGQRGRIPEQVKNDRLYRLRPESHALIEALLDTLDGYVEDINQFCQATNVQHLTMTQKQVLGLSPSGGTKVLYERWRSWATGW
jgi:hypothetical protein